MTNKKKQPVVADLINDAVLMISQAMKGEETPLKAQELSIYLNMLLGVDKNNRDIKATFQKGIAEMTDEQIEEELAKLAAKE